MRMILSACHRGVAAMVVTHDAQLASWADRVVFIRDGRDRGPDGAAADPRSRCWPTSRHRAPAASTAGASGPARAALDSRMYLNMILSMHLGDLPNFDAGLSGKGRSAR